MTHDRNNETPPPRHRDGGGAHAEENRPRTYRVELRDLWSEEEARAYDEAQRARHAAGNRTAGSAGGSHSAGSPGGSSAGGRRRKQGGNPQEESFFVRFARQYGWRAYAIPVLLVITVWVLWDVVFTGSDPEPAESSPAAASHEHSQQAGPNPAEHTAAPVGIKELPAGGAFTEKGEGTYRVVGKPGAAAGEGTEKVVRYVVEIENGVDTSSYGGDDALANMVDATLTNPKGWIADPRFRFEHVAADQNPTMRIQLTSTGTTHATCGNDLEMETSCFYQDGQRLVINESRWVRGASPFDGDLGSYRQYLLNHEMGHGLGYAAHEPCGGTGELAPVMMQQTLSLDNSVLYSIDSSEVYPDDGAHCLYNPWPYPKGAQ